MPIGLLAVIPATLSHWVYYLFSWAFSAHLLCLYLLFCPCVILATLAHWAYDLFSQASSAHLPYLYLLLHSWACWLSLLLRWPIEFITLLLPLILLFPLILLIVGLVLHLFSKMDVNIQPSKHVDCSYNSHTNNFAILFRGFFEQWSSSCSPFLP